MPEKKGIDIAAFLHWAFAVQKVDVIIGAGVGTKAA